MTPPSMPVGEARTNCNMHNYRVQWQQFGCDTAILLDNLVNRQTEGKTRVKIPEQCLKILEEENILCSSR